MFNRDKNQDASLYDPVFAPQPHKRGGGLKKVAKAVTALALVACVSVGSVVGYNYFFPAQTPTQSGVGNNATASQTVYLPTYSADAMTAPEIFQKVVPSAVSITTTIQSYGQVGTGTGTGIIPILLEAKTGGEHFTGLEIQEESADMARRSVALNDLQDRIDIVTGDIKEADRIFQAASFDCITCNPPYMIGQHGLTNPEEPKAIARHEVLCTLEDVVSRTAKLLKPGGHFYMVHRPFRLAEIMTMLVKYKLEPKRMQLVYPYIDKEPNMVLIEAVRGGRSRMTVEKPLIVYQSPGVYMPEIYDIYGY